MSFENDMATLAATIAKNANLPDTPLPERVDAFKALTPYLTLLRKDKGADKTKSDVPTFMDFKTQLDALKEQPDGGQIVPSGRGRN